MGKFDLLIDVTLWWKGNWKIEFTSTKTIRLHIKEVNFFRLCVWKKGYPQNKVVNRTEVEVTVKKGTD